MQDRAMRANCPAMTQNVGGKVVRFLRRASLPGDALQLTRCAHHAHDFAELCG
jgi:hypothetical protein